MEHPYSRDAAKIPNVNRNFFSLHPSIASTSPNIFHRVNYLCNPAFTEAAYVGCHHGAFETVVRRLSIEGDGDRHWNWHWDPYLDAKMADLDVSPGMTRSSSHHSTTSVKSYRSGTVRVKPRKYSSYMSSSASSITSSDKSLTSFPSFSPESPADRWPLPPQITDGPANSTRKPSDPFSIVESLTATTPSSKTRTALFDDTALPITNLPGALHHASDEHINRLIARDGAVKLVRQIAEDLAQRDSQISTLRRKAEERERLLRKIILECGLSNLDLEIRLKAIEEEQKSMQLSSRELAAGGDGLTDLMSDAMSDTVVLEDLNAMEIDATLKASDALRALQVEKQSTNTQRGWKDYLWGTGTSRKSSRASSVDGEVTPALSIRNGPPGRRTVLANGVFQPPETTRSTSRASSIQSSILAPGKDRKPSMGLAGLALKLVAGSATASGEDVSGRGRADSAGVPAARARSSASSNTSKSAMAAPAKPTPKAIPAGRRPTAGVAPVARGVQHERWDTMGASPQTIAPGAGSDNNGPVEMDTILPPDAQPPTVTQTYHSVNNPEFLTDRFGFIYDQRRKKRQKEAADRMQKTKRGSRIESLTGARGGLSPISADFTFDGPMLDDRPDTPVSMEDDGKPGKRWQDYLKIATFPTELLSHTPSAGIPAFEVMEGGEVPQSPGITTEDRGFLPATKSTVASPAVSVAPEEVAIGKSDGADISPDGALTQEDKEPVKLLLKQLGEVHDSLQHEKTIKWNDFLRKVRAERKRDGEAAAAAFAADTRSSRQMALMPEATLTDGEMIGVAGLGNKGKVGRAKWNEFKSLVLGGIPVSYRAKIWAECSGATALRIPGYYDDLVSRSSENDDPAIVAQIEMDINRTLTDNIFFRRGPGVSKLNEVLLAYSRRNVEVGYCQGMNLITACLLLIMPTAEDTFWVLTSIIESILPRGYYDHSLLASRADQQVLRQYVASILPKLSLHLDDLSIELEALTFQWFLSVFTDCLSAEALFRVWDVVLCTNDGSTFLFQVALALLKLNEQELLKCDTPAGVYTYINHQMTNHAISIDGLIHASEGLRKVVRRDEVENRRGKAIEAEKNLIKQREERNRERRGARIITARKENEDLKFRGGDLVLNEPLPVG